MGIIKVKKKRKSIDLKKTHECLLFSWTWLGLWIRVGSNYVYRKGTVGVSYQWFVEGREKVLLPKRRRIPVETVISRS